MQRSTLVFHTPPGRSPRLLLATTAAGAVAAVLWWALAPRPAAQATAQETGQATAQATGQPAPTVRPQPGWAGSASPFVPTTLPPTATPLPSMPTPLSTAPAAVVPPPLPLQPAPPAALSTMVAPGVHITPMGLPPGAVPVPAGPRPHDSEPEN